MSARPAHKRALSLLTRDKGKSDGREDDATSDTNHSPTATSATSSPISASTSHNPLTLVRSARQHAPAVGSTAGQSSGQSPLNIVLEPIESNQSLETADSVSPSGIKDGKMSIEESVRTFRLFEVLRSGDTTAISRILKEPRPDSLAGTTILHLAIQCAEPQVVEYVISNNADIGINAQDREGNTPLHLAAQLGRTPIVKQLLELPSINDAIPNYHGRQPIDLARTPEIFGQLQLARALFIDTATKEIHRMIAAGEYEQFEKLITEPRIESSLDVNALELATDPATTQTGGTLLHEAARRRDIKLIQLLLMHGADPFRRDRKGKLPQDVTKDDRTRGILKKSPAAAMAQRGVQEKAILGNNPGQRTSVQTTSGEGTLAGKDGREMKGYLKKWTNYTSGYKLRWFVLEDGVLSYYKHQGEWREWF